MSPSPAVRNIYQEEVAPLTTDGNSNALSWTMQMTSSQETSWDTRHISTNWIEISKLRDGYAGKAK